MVDHEGLGLFKRANGSLASYGREVLDKLVQGLSSFDVIQKGLEGDTRAAKNRRPTKNVLVARDHFVVLGEQRVLSPNFPTIISLPPVATCSEGQIAFCKASTVHPILCR